MRYLIVTYIIIVSSSTVRADQAYSIPYTGYEYEYTASSGDLPDKQGWVNSGYSDVTATIVPDSLTGENTLRLDHSNASGLSPYAVWDQIGSEGVGTHDDFFTLDLRFRLTDPIETNQLTLAVFRPPNSIYEAAGHDEQKYVLRFGVDEVHVAQNSGDSTYATSFENEWHDARLLIDNSHGSARLYLDGSTTPIFSSTASGGNLGRNLVRFGDGSSLVGGTAQVSHIKWTNHSMAVPIVGGQVDFLDRNIVATNNEHVNFIHGSRFSDGTMWLSHSIGTHTVTERSKQLWSLDDGETWTSPEINNIASINTYQFSDGHIIGLAAWNRDYTTNHRLGFRQWDGPQSDVVFGSKEVVLPWNAQLFLTRDLIRAGNGNLIQTAYVRTEDDLRFRAITLRSADEGMTWLYGSTVAYDPNSRANYGLTETSIVSLTDDTLLALTRSGSGSDIGPLMQSKSTDYGLSWSVPAQIADFGVDPTVIRIANGALVASSGRPGVYLLIDITGTGDNWQEVSVYDGPGSSYTSLIEIEPNLIMLLHDESSFGTDFDMQLPDGIPNRVYASYFRVTVPEPTTFLFFGTGLLVAINTRKNVLRS